MLEFFGQEKKLAIAKRDTFILSKTQYLRTLKRIFIFGKTINLNRRKTLNQKCGLRYSGQFIREYFFSPGAIWQLVGSFGEKIKTTLKRIRIEKMAKIYYLLFICNMSVFILEIFVIFSSKLIIFIIKMGSLKIKFISGSFLND